MIRNLTGVLTRGVLPLSLAAVLVGVLAAQSAHAYPEPAIVSKSWNLTFTHGKPTPIAVPDAITGHMCWYWYMTYKVVNDTGQERIFVPEVSLATEAGDMIDAGRDVPANVFPAIKAREGNKLMESPNQVVGRVLQGDDYAKESVIIWPAFDHTVNELSVFVAGLSGESQSVPNPAKPGQSVVVRKTLMINYTLPGANTNPQDQAVLGKGEQWIMR